MIKSFNGYDAKAPAGKREQLPVGGFVSKILRSKLDYVGTFLKLFLTLEITEGEYKDFFMKDYELQKGGQYEPKYKGVFRIDVPDDDSPDWVKTRFNRAMGSIEASNPGFKFDWDESKLKGKTVGFLTQEDEYNGNTFTTIGMLYDASKIREGNFKPMKKRERKEESNKPMSQADAVTSGMMSVDDDDLPF